MFDFNVCAKNVGHRYTQVLFDRFKDSNVRNDAARAKSLVALVSALLKV